MLRCLTCKQCLEDPRILLLPPQNSNRVASREACSALIFWHVVGAGPQGQVQVHERCVELVGQGRCGEERSAVLMLWPRRLQCTVHLCSKRQLCLLRTPVTSTRRAQGSCGNLTANCFREDRSALLVLRPRQLQRTV